MIELHRLQVLRAAAHHGSFAAAAAALGYTPSAVSQQIAGLERELGTVLFDRGGRVLRVTEAGRVLLEHADRALARLDAAELELARLRDEDAPLRLAAFPAAWHALMPAGVAALRPLSMQLHESQPQDALAALRAGELDGALVFSPHPAVDRASELELEEWFSEPFFAMLPPRHRLARHERLRLDDLAGERWVRPSESCFAAVAEACAFVPDVVFESRDFLAARGTTATPARRIVFARAPGERPGWAETLRRALVPAAARAAA